MKEFLVEESQPTRLDRFVRRNIAYLSQGVIEKSLRNGQIKLNSKAAKTSTRVGKGDLITISTALINEDKDTPSKTNFSQSVISLGHKILDQYLIFSCADFIAINKPSGLAVQGGSKINISIDHALLYLNSSSSDAHYRLVHRLDKGTSGILIIARNLRSTILLGDAFKNKLLQKTYIATCSGNVTNLPKCGSVEGYIAKSRSGTYELVQSSTEGKFAKTLYEVLSVEGRFITIKYIPLTGRMHQLRFHSKQLGCPILGDIKYGGEKFERMMLHALELKIPASIFGREYNLKAPFI